MFEITPQDIAQLDDKQLRTLIGLLCEAELRRRGYSTSAVTWGGDQNAKDGGLDVRVSLAEGRPMEGFIPRPSTGFQVKRQDMPPSAIAAEMIRNGELRPVIKELAAGNGAYVIVSSEGSTSDSALANRRNAMASAAAGLVEQLLLDFYDRTRLASWVRNHAGLVVWVRREIGRSIPGWEPFGAWAYPAGGIEAEYLVEKGIRLRVRPTEREAELSTEAGLKKIRETLRTPGTVVRLVGLSGVGKTRFVQALFDSRIGDEALDPSLAVYTNMNNDPSPQPSGLASDFIANGTRAILIVDNCAAELHARLSGIAKSPASLLSVLTVEYDIREDQPEGTEVLEMLVSSTELIRKLVKNRFPCLSDVDASTAADSSGGNARIAIALADTVGRSGSLASLNDAQLFERLFVQRQDQDRSLLEMAQALALVYSFDGQDESDDGELARIARCIGATADQAHRHIAELLRRDLAQRRGKWRAILPHALANRLAATALQNIPFARIRECLIDGAPERLTISLARRLGYLHASPEAIAIARDWLNPDGWIGSEIWNLNQFGRAMFENSLPAAPEVALEALEIKLAPHAPDRPITTGSYVLRALRSIAWDAACFDRCVSLLECLAVYGEEEIARQARETHTSLFQLVLSGTHATAGQRATVIKRLLSSESPSEIALGSSALNAMLKTGYFSGSGDFQFGSRSRDYGFQPSTRAELNDWYQSAIGVAKEIALSGRVAAASAKAAIAVNFRGLWTQIGLHDELEDIAANLAARDFWSDGWLAVKQTRLFDEKDESSPNYDRLSRLEEMLRPRDLVQRVRGRVLASKAGLFAFDEIDPADSHSFKVAADRQTEEAVALGGEVANDSSALQELLPEIVSRGGRLWHFGIGLARGTKDPRKLWCAMEIEFAKIPMENRDVGAFCGMLDELAARGSILVEEFLDRALVQKHLNRYFPALQSSTPINSRGVTRLNRSLEIGKAPIQAYGDIHLESISGADVASFLEKLAQAPDGESVAIHFLSMHFFHDQQGKRQHSPEVIAAGRALLQRISSGLRTPTEDYYLREVVKVCVEGADGYGATVAICQSLRRAILEEKTYGLYNIALLNALSEFQPEAILDALLTGDENEIAAGRKLIGEARGFESHLLGALSEGTLLAWCEKDPPARFPMAAALVSPFKLSSNGDPIGWAPIALRLVHGAPDPIAVMSEFIERFRPAMWSGSRSVILDTGARLLDEFDARENIALAAFIATQREKLQREARTEAAWETKWGNERDERFE
jgi:hypothetical protein